MSKLYYGLMRGANGAHTVQTHPRCCAVVVESSHDIALLVSKVDVCIARSKLKASVDDASHDPRHLEIIRYTQ